MTDRSKNIVASTVFAIVCILPMLLYYGLPALPRLTKPDLSCSVIHEPKAGCPAGYVREKKPRFIERDGRKEFACTSEDPTKQPCFDQLAPGESMQIEMQLEIGPPDQAPAPDPVQPHI